MKRIKLIAVISAIVIISSTISYSGGYTATLATYPVNVNNERLSATVLNLNGSTYLQIRPVSEALGVPISWTGKSVEINTLDVDKLKEACVMIYADDGKTQVQGSGVYIDYDQVLTANHVIDKRPNVKESDGDILTIEDTNSTIDIATLDSTEKVKPVKIGDSDDVKVGDKIIVVSAPNYKEDTVSYGKVLQLKPLGADEILIGVDLAGGSSGGACFDSSGNLIGMVVAGGEKQFFLIPINAIRKAL